MTEAGPASHKKHFSAGTSGGLGGGCLVVLVWVGWGLGRHKTVGLEQLRLTKRGGLRPKTITNQAFLQKVLFVTGKGLASHKNRFLSCIRRDFMEKLNFVNCAKNGVL